MRCSTACSREVSRLGIELSTVLAGDPDEVSLIAALVLAALSPVALFILFNAPPLASAETGDGAQYVTLLTDVLFVGYAGVVAGNRRFAFACSPACA